MNQERVDRQMLEKRLEKTDAAFGKMDRVAIFEGTPNLNRPLESLTQLSGLDRITQAAELAQRRMAIQSRLNDNAKPVLISQREKLQSQLAAEANIPPVNNFDQTEAAVLATLFINRNGVKVKQDERLLFAFDLPESYLFICQELVHRQANSSRIPMDQLAIIRSEVIRKVSAIVEGDNLEDIDRQEESIKELLKWLYSQELDKFKGHLSQFLTESPALKARSFKSFVETDTVERVWNLPNGNGNGHTKAENVLAEPVQPNVARVEAEKQFQQLKVNLETKEIQLEKWDSAKRISSDIEWAILTHLAINAGEKVSTQVLREIGQQAGSKDNEVSSDAVYRLRQILEPDPKNPAIITSHGRTQNASYTLNTHVEFVGELSKEALEIAKKYRESQNTYETTLPDGRNVSDRYGPKEKKVLERLKLASFANPVSASDLASSVYGEEVPIEVARKRMGRGLMYILRKKLAEDGYRIINKEGLYFISESRKIISKQEAERVKRYKEAPKTFEVALPDDQSIRIKGRIKAKTLEYLVQMTRENKPVETDKAALELFGNSNQKNRQRVSDTLRDLRKDLELIGYKIEQPVSAEERKKGQKAQYSLVKVEEDIKTKKTIVSKEPEVQFPKLKINLDSKEVQLEGWGTTKLFQGVISWAILVHLSENAGRTIPKEVLQSLAKEFGSHSDAAVKTAVFELRRLIEPDPKDPQVIVTTRSGKETHYSLKAQVEFVREEPKLLGSEEQKKVEAGHYYEVELPEGPITRIKGKIKSDALKILVQAAREGKPIRANDFSDSLYGNHNRKAMENSRQAIKDLKKDLKKPGYQIKKLGKYRGNESYFSLEKESVDAHTSPNSTGTSDSKTRQEAGIGTVLPKEEATQPEIETQSINSLPFVGQDQLIADDEGVDDKFSASRQELIDSDYLSEEELKLLNDNTN